MPGQALGLLIEITGGDGRPLNFDFDLEPIPCNFLVKTFNSSF
jgi:hypothetical protein